MKEAAEIKSGKTPDKSPLSLDLHKKPALVSGAPLPPPPRKAQKFLRHASNTEKRIEDFFHPAVTGARGQKELQLKHLRIPSLEALARRA